MSNHRTTHYRKLCCIAMDSYLRAYITGDASLQSVSVQSASQNSTWWVTNVAEGYPLLKIDDLYLLNLQISMIGIRFMSKLAVSCLL